MLIENSFLTRTFGTLCLDVILAHNNQDLTSKNANVDTCIENSECEPREDEM